MVVNAIGHFRQISENQFIDYGRENRVSAALIILVGLIEFWKGGSISAALFLFITAPAVRWLVHDLTLNYLRGLPWDYLGTRSKLDKMLRGWQQSTRIHFVFLKVIALAVSIGIAFLVIYYAIPNG